MRTKKRWTTPSEVISEIDRVYSEIRRLRLLGERLDNQADALLAVNSYKAVVAGKQKREEADEAWRKAEWLQGIKLARLQESLAILQTPELPGCQVKDKNGNIVTGIPA